MRVMMGWTCTLEEKRFLAHRLPEHAWRYIGSGIPAGGLEALLKRNDQVFEYVKTSEQFTFQIVIHGDAGNNAGERGGYWPKFNLKLRGDDGDNGSFFCLQSGDQDLVADGGASHKFKVTPKKRVRRSGYQKKKDSVDSVDSYSSIRLFTGRCSMAAF